MCLLFSVDKFEMENSSEAMDLQQFNEDTIQNCDDGEKLGVNDKESTAGSNKGKCTCFSFFFLFTLLHIKGKLRLFIF